MKEEKRNNANMYIDNIRLIDDSFFEIFFRDDPKYIEVVIHEIFKHIGRPLASIEKVETQSRLHSLGYRELCLDLLATDSNKNKINIEIQRTTINILTKRARYHSALLDSNTLDKNHDFCELMENYIIFITEKDFRKLGKPIYQVERVFLEDQAPFNDGTHILFVNGQYQHHDTIGNIMKDFFSRGAEQMNNPVLAERMKYLKETEEGRKELSGIEIQIASEAKAEGKVEGNAEGKLEVAINLLQLGKSPIELISQATGFSIEFLKELQSTLPTPA